ncbi:MAG: hypothetical protein AB1710_04285 [Pseudomonadota bacterium]
MRNILILLVLSVLLNISGAHAEKAPPPEESCADGYYNGPRAGRKNYSHDKYLWVVTPEFAKRFCMPPEFVDEGLKGAEAIAFRMSTSTGGSDRCAVIDGKEACSGDHELRFDIFLRSDLNLPATNPDIKFYDGSRDDAGWHISIKERFIRSRKYKTGEYKLPPGKIPHFENPYNDFDHGNYFALVGVHEGKGKWPITRLSEWSYRAEWAKGLDLLVLQDHPGLGSFDNPRMEPLNIRQFAIVSNKRGDERKHGERSVPEDYAHVIWLPEKFYEKVKAAATARSQGFFEQLRILRQQ